MLDRLPAGVLELAVSRLDDDVDRLCAAAAVKGPGAAPVPLPPAVRTARARTLAAALAAGHASAEAVEALELRSRGKSAAAAVAASVAVASMPRLRHLSLRACPVECLRAVSQGARASGAPLAWLRVELVRDDGCDDGYFNIGPCVDGLPHLRELEVRGPNSRPVFQPALPCGLHRLDGCRPLDYRAVPELRVLFLEWVHSFNSRLDLPSAVDQLEHLRAIDVATGRDRELDVPLDLEHGGATTVAVMPGRGDRPWPSREESENWSFSGAHTLYLKLTSRNASVVDQVSAEAVGTSFPALRRVVLVRMDRRVVVPEGAAERVAARLPGVEVGVSDYDGGWRGWSTWFSRNAAGLPCPPDFLDV